MANCNICGKDAGYLHSVCPSCKGLDITETKNNQPVFGDNPLALAGNARADRAGLGTWVLGVGIALVVVLIFLVSFGNTPQAKEKGIKRTAIEQCWKDYERKSIDPNTKRFVASVCEKMESDFSKEYGLAP